MKTTLILNRGDGKVEITELDLNQEIIEELLKQEKKHPRCFMIEEEEYERLIKEPPAKE